MGGVHSEAGIHRTHSESRVFSQVPHGTQADLDAAVDAAAEAFKSWSVLQRRKQRLNSARKEMTWRWIRQGLSSL